MKLTTKQLKKLIKEELGRLYENDQAQQCMEMYESLPTKVKILVDRFKDSGGRYAINDLYSAALGDEALKSYYPDYENEELMMASNFLEQWFVDCEGIGPAFDIEDFLGNNDWIMNAENIDDIEENLEWFIETEDIDLEDFDVSFEQLVAMIRKKADEGYGI